MKIMKSAFRKTKVKRGWRDNVFLGICTVILTLALILVLFPILNIVAASFSNPTEVSAGKVWFWPVDFSLESYRNVLKYRSVVIGYKNTIFYTVAGTLIQVSCTMTAAFVFSRKNLKGLQLCMLLRKPLWP